jgi:hypothetical protein
VIARFTFFVPKHITVEIATHDELLASEPLRIIDHGFGQLTGRRSRR